MRRLTDAAPCGLVVTWLALFLSVGLARGERLIRVPGGVSSFGVDATRKVAYVANRGGIFTLDVSTSELVAASALGPFDTIGDVDPATGLVAVYTFGGGPGPGIFDPGTGRVRSLAHGNNPPQGAVFAGGLLYVPIFECLGTCGPLLEALSLDGQVVAQLPLLVVQPGCAARSADGSRILVGDALGGSVLVVGTAGFAVEDAIPVGATPCPVAVAGDVAVVAGNGTTAIGSPRGSVLLLDLVHPRSVPRAVEFARSVVRGVAIDPDRRVAYAVVTRGNRRRGRLITLQLERWKIGRETTLSRRLGAPEAVAVSGEGSILVGGENGVLITARRLRKPSSGRR